MASQDLGLSAQLTAGPSQPSYGAFRPNNATSSTSGNQNSANYSPSFAAPGPISPQSLQDSRQPASVIKRIVACLIILILCSLVAYRSDTVRNYWDITSEARRASAEASALVAEREKWEQEKDSMRHDREVWEKVPESRVPPGAYWDYIGYVYACPAYGKREYHGTLRDVPEGWSAIDTCMNTPVSIDMRWDQPAVEIRQPYRCALVDSSVQGYWIVDRYQHECKPKLENVHDTGCTNYRSGLTRIEAQVVNILPGKKQNWRVMCESTPFNWDGVNYTSPTHCEERPGSKVAMWDVPAESCR